MSDAFAIVILVIGVVGFVVIFRGMRGFDARGAEDEARAFYDEHGHWPDQTAEEAEAERRDLARAYSVTAPDEHDRV